MKKLSAFIVAAAVIISVSVLAGCESREKAQVVSEGGSELEQTQRELEQIKKDSSKLDKYITDLKKEINTLKIENQRLIAQTKRLEAEIIDLKLELGQVPDSDSADALEKDAEPAPGGDAAAQTESAPTAEEPPAAH